VIEIPVRDYPCDSARGKESSHPRGANTNDGGAIPDGSGLPCRPSTKPVTVIPRGRSIPCLSRSQAVIRSISGLCLRRAGETSAVQHPEAENGKSRDPSVSFADATEARRPGTASVASRRPGISEVWFCGSGAGAVCNLQPTPPRMVYAATLSRVEGCTVDIGGECNVCE
jgi:hypothetical protein